MFPAVGSQPTKVYIDLSRLPGVDIPTFHPIQTDPAPAHALFALDNNPSATQAFTLIATVLGKSTEALATQLGLADIDSSKACLLAAGLRDRPLLVTTKHLMLFEETEGLGRRLEAKLGGLAQVATTEVVTATPAADARPTFVMPSDFYELALATLDDAKSLILFRRSRSFHPEWEALSRTIPPHLVAAADEWEDAKSAASLAEHEHEQALAGMFYNEWILPARRDREATVRALSERAEHAEARRVAGIELVNKTQHDRTVAENAVAEQWLQARAVAFRTRFAAYKAALQECLQTIEATRSGAYVLRGWKESCACIVLLEIGSVLLEVLDPTEREADWWGTLCLGERFDDLDHDAWRDLRIDVRQEAAKVRGSQPTGGSPNGLPPRADEPVGATEAARAQAERMTTPLAPAAKDAVTQPIPAAAQDLAAQNILAHFLGNDNTSTTTENLYAVSTVSERKTEELLRLMHSRCSRCDDVAAACPEHLGLLEHEKGKVRGWHRATDWGLEVARRQKQ